MTKRKLDYLSRRQVLPVMLISPPRQHLINERLPGGYILDNGKFRFPAGYWENYFVNGKMYNPEGNRTLHEQQELIAKDLKEEGFTEEEINEFIQEIETQEGRPMRLSVEASNEWLRHHPEHEKEALRLINEINKEIHSETKSELRGRRY